MVLSTSFFRKIDNLILSDPQKQRNGFLEKRRDRIPSIKKKEGSPSLPIYYHGFL